MAGRKEQIDWEAIERDYRLGQLSIRELARRFGIEPSTITRKAAKDAWVRDLSQEVKARTRAGLVELAKEKAQQLATESNVALRDGIDVAVESNLRKISEHQSSIGQNQGRLLTMQTKLDSMIPEAESLHDMVKAASAFESLVRSQKTLIALEREALGLDEKDGETPKTQNQVDDELEKLLKKAMNGNRGV